MLKGTSSFCIFYLSWDLRRCLEWDQHRKSFLAEHINVLKAIGGIKTKAFQSESPLNRMGSSTACFEYFQPVSRKPVGWTGSGNSRTFWRSWRRCSFWSNLRATGTWLVHGRIFSFPYVFLKIYISYLSCHVHVDSPLSLSLGSRGTWFALRCLVSTALLPAALAMVCPTVWDTSVSCFPCAKVRKWISGSDFWKHTKIFNLERLQRAVQTPICHW